MHIYLSHDESFLEVGVYPTGCLRSLGTFLKKREKRIVTPINDKMMTLATFQLLLRSDCWRVRLLERFELLDPNKKMKYDMLTGLLCVRGKLSLTLPIIEPTIHSSWDSLIHSYRPLKIFIMCRLQSLISN